MDTFKIYGGKSLKGEIKPQGAKNEALQIICATLLTPEKVTVYNVPEIRDVVKLIELLDELGVIIHKLEKGTYSFQAASPDINKLSDPAFMKRVMSLRGSVMIIGPLLGRFGKAIIPQPGGDKIGRRRLDTHFIGLQKLGAKFEADTKNNIYTLKAKNLKALICFLMKHLLLVLLILLWLLFLPKVLLQFLMPLANHTFFNYVIY